MKKSNFIMLIAGIICIAGLVVGTIGISMGGFNSAYIDKKGVHIHKTDSKYIESINKTFTEKIDDIELDVNMYDLALKQGDEFNLSGNFDSKFTSIKSKIENGKLLIKEKSKNRFPIFDFWNNNKNHRKLVLTYPKNISLQSLIIDSNMGDTKISNINSKILSVESSMGNTKISNIHSEFLSAKLDYGNLNFSKITADTIKVSDSLGNINLDNIISKNIKLNNASGNISTKNIESKELTADLSLGDSKFVGNLTGEVVVKSSAGEVLFDINTPLDKLAYNLKVDAGAIKINGEAHAGEIISSKTGQLAPTNLKVKSSLGEIILNTP